MEEFEALEAIYGEDIKVSLGTETPKCYTVEYSLDKSNVLQFQFEAQDDSAILKPTVRVIGVLCDAKSLETLLGESLTSKIEPGYLFEAIETAKQWMEENKEGMPCSNQDSSQETPVCKFFLQKQCRFGESCNFRHPIDTKSEMLGHMKEAGTLTHSTEPSGPMKGKHACQEKDKDNRKFESDKRDSQEKRSDKKKPSMKTAIDVINRIMWDESCPADDFIVGYLDRFVGIVEKSFSSFSWEDIASVDYSTLAIPKHRIQYFKYKDVVVWDKRTRVDKVFGSTGDSERILDIIENYDTSARPSKSNNVNSNRNDIHASAFGMEAGDLEDYEEDCQHDEEGRSMKRCSNEKNRPNFFFCFRIKTNEIKNKIAKIQADIVAYEDILKDACLKPDELHVTLCMLRLNNDEEKAKAIKVMREEIQPSLPCMLPRSHALLLGKLGNFHGRVLHVEVKKDDALDKLVNLLMIKLEVVGLNTCGSKQPYCPHVTITKLSRPMCKALNTSEINPTYYAPYREEHFGYQAVDEVFLCSTDKQRDDSGFYVKLATASNSLLYVSQEIGNAVSQYANELLKRGILSEEEGDMIVEALMTTEDPEEFEKAICNFENILAERARQIQQDESNRRDVLIMRGLPGSGKSYLIKNSIEARQADAENEADPRKNVVVCGADEYFADSQSGYSFNASDVMSAHSHCHRKFVSAIVTNARLIVIDNTNSQTWEYQIYKRIAKLCGYRIRLLEIACKDEETLQGYIKRGRHNVSKHAMTRMWQRWEEDKDSVIIYPCLHQNGEANYSLIGLIDDAVKRESVVVHPKGILFSAVFLDEASKARLLDTFPSAHPKVTASHMTLTYKPMSEQLPHIPVGKRVSLSVVGHVCNDVMQAVAVTEMGEPLCGTEVPHMTISHSKKASPKHAKNVLANVKQWTRPVEDLVLTGLIGVQVAVTEKTSCTITDVDVFNHVLCELDKLIDTDNVSGHAGKSCKSQNAEIYIGPTEHITSLFIFDFDGTLFHVPEQSLGRRQYKELTGVTWPHKGWFGRPESLQFPLRSYPGPAFVQFKEHIERAGSLTVLLTARRQCVKDGIEEVLQQHGIHPQKKFLKPMTEDDSYKTNRSPNFKTGLVKDLLKAYPNVDHVKIWDDRPDNIDAFRRLRKSFGNIKFEIFDVGNDYSRALAATLKDVSTITDAFGSCRFESFNAAAKEGIEFLVNAWSSCLDVDMDVGRRFAIPFGSFPLKRVGDVDLCLLASAKLSQDECIVKLETELSKRGIKHLHSATRIRCPRLKVRLHFMHTSPVDFDIVFAPCLEDIRSKDLDSPETLYRNGCSKLKSSLEGVLFLRQVQHCIDGKISVENFGRLVDAVVLLLKTKHAKGNGFHCVRTFHIVRALAEMFGKFDATTKSLDVYFQDSLQYLSTIDIAHWKKICKEFVPEDMLIRTTEVFKNAVTLLNKSEPVEKIFAFVKFPPHGHKLVKVAVESHVSELAWRGGTLLEAKLGTCLRKLVSYGVSVVPGPSDYCNMIQFAIPADESSLRLCRDALKSLESEAVFIDYQHDLRLHIDIQ
eukprot:gene8777-9715_t